METFKEYSIVFTKKGLAICCIYSVMAFFLSMNIGCKKSQLSSETGKNEKVRIYKDPRIDPRGGSINITSTSNADYLIRFMSIIHSK